MKTYKNDGTWVVRESVAEFHVPDSRAVFIILEVYKILGKYEYQITYTENLEWRVRVIRG